MNKATVYRLLGELQAFGVVEQAGSGHSYRLGPAVLRLAALREATVPTREVAISALQNLSDITGETAHLSLVQGDRLATVGFTYAAENRTAVRMDDAEFLPFHATATGHAVLAFASPEFTDRILSGPLHEHTSATPTDRREILARLQKVRATGLAEMTGGFEEDAHSLAVPLFNANAACIGAVAVAAPKSRMTPALRARIIPALSDCAQRIVTLWGGTLPQDMPKESFDAG